MIGITGIARSGKDTLGLSLLKMINKSSTKKAKIYSIANIIKKDLNNLIKKQFGFSAFTEDTGEKNLIRPILVEYGEAMKVKYGKNIWIDKLIQNINFKKYIPIITDVRFDHEIKKLTKEHNAFIIHICRVGAEVPNELEKINDPKAKELSHIQYMWPTFGKNKLHLANDHTSILWQMVYPEYKEKWKTLN